MHCKFLSITPLMLLPWHYANSIIIIVIIIM